MFKEGTPSNTIIFKKLCGIGATHGEARTYKRHSIIIVPNTPVLKGKQEACDESGNKKYPDIFTVFEGVSQNQLLDYLNGDTIYKKVLCTPEAYISKVKPVFEAQNQFSLFEDFFMLIDECDKMITDSDFRNALVAPMDDFFLFKNKAMISATAITPSDNRFKEHNFKRLYVKPKFNAKQIINLIETNNIIGAMQDEFRGNKEDRFFIFINSADLILAIIKLLQIENKSKVFCAPNSKTKLKDSGFDCVSTDLGDYSQYNFLTSRFYNAVDIELDEQPRVILVTDIRRTSYSMLDPYSDSVQIVGRFRNKVKSISHISNFDNTLASRNTEEAMKFIKSIWMSYSGWVDIVNNTTDEGEKYAHEQAIKACFLHQYVKDNGALDSYRIDGYLLDERIKRYYNNAENLHNAYIISDSFKPSKTQKFYTANDQKLISIIINSTSSVLIKHVAEILNANNGPQRDGNMLFVLGRSNEVLKKHYPEISEFYEKLGFSKMEELKFNKSTLSKELKRKKEFDARFKPELVAEIQSLYKIGDTATRLEVIASLTRLNHKYGNEKGAKASDLNHYYKTRITSNCNNEKVFKIEAILSLN